jgi:crotonobetainyl-CoA:carnitine CoA-transferase CaiB-like acyl-CoA transferase
MGSGDTYGGIMSALGIMMALHQRRKTGKGQYVDASLYGAQLFMSAPTLQPFLASKNPLYAEQQSRKEARNPLWNRYEAADKWVFLCEENEDTRWAALCKSFSRESLANDSRFASPEKRRENHAALVAEIDGIVKGRKAEDWMAAWNGLGIVASPIQNLKEMSEDPQAWANDYFLKAHCSEVNREVEIRGLPVTLGKTPGKVETLGPELGQDTEILLMELLEMEWEKIEELKAEGVIP